MLVFLLIELTGFCLLSCRSESDEMGGGCGLEVAVNGKMGGNDLGNSDAGFGDMALFMVLCTVRLLIENSDGLFSSTRHVHLMIMNALTVV